MLSKVVIVPAGSNHQSCVYNGVVALGVNSKSTIANETQGTTGPWLNEDSWAFPLSSVRIKDQEISL
jgi:hypothetical protein